MNIPIGVVVLLLVASPGILFRFFYRTGFYFTLSSGFKGSRRWFTPASLGSFTEETAYGVVVSLLFHLVVCSTFCFDLARTVRTLIDPTSINSISTELVIQFVIYSLASSVAGAALGAGLHHLVRSLHLDLLVPFLRFPNMWIYTFSGEEHVRDLIGDPQRIQTNSLGTWKKEFEELIKEIKVIRVVALVGSGGAAMEYTGALESYHFTGDDLNRIVLTLVNVKEGSGVPKPVLGDFVVIPARELRSISVSFLR